MRIEKLNRPGQLRDWLEESIRDGAGVFALDLETTGLGKGESIISAAITGPNENWVGFIDPGILPELLATPANIEFIFHNASFDLKHLSWAGIRLQDHYQYHDTLVMAHLLNENGSHSLGGLVETYYEDKYKKTFWTKYKKSEEAPEEELAEYNAKDVHYTFLLHILLRKSLVLDGIPDSLVSHVHKLQRSLLETEISGIAVDRDYLMQKGVELKTRIEGLLPKMHQSVKDEILNIECDIWCDEMDKRKTDKGKAAVPKPRFSFDSSKQLMQLLYTQLALPPQVNDKTKKPSVDYDSLEKIKDQHPLVAMIQEYRELQKVYGTYIEGTLERMVNGRVYPSFNVCGTATGRISHSNPNLGQLPRAGGVRGIYTPDAGSVFISADFSQLEVSLSAHFTQDANLLCIVNEGVSQHDITASSLGIERGIAKNVNFACQYGAGAFKLAKMLGVSNADGEKALKKYWETYSGQKRVMDECAAKVDSGEPIISPYGRRRRFEKRKRASWDSAYRRAWNSLVQGTGSDCTSRAFYLTNSELVRRGLGRALFTVHDEIICQVKKEHAEEAQKILIDTMQQVGVDLGLTVRLKAEGSGPMERWCD